MTKGPESIPGKILSITTGDPEAVPCNIPLTTGDSEIIPGNLLSYNTGF